MNTFATKAIDASQILINLRLPEIYRIGHQ